MKGSFFAFLFCLHCLFADQSWVASANQQDHNFPIQNLPLGVFSKKGESLEPRIGVAIGDFVLDVKGAIQAGWMSEFDENLIEALQSDSLNALMRLGKRKLHLFRKKITELLQVGSKASEDLHFTETLLIPMNQVSMKMPVKIGDYTDFYASIDHATNVGSLFRPKNPLMPNYKNLPVAYHGRSSSIVLSGTNVVRPMGQIFSKIEEKPEFALCKNLDYEMELGIFIGKENDLGRRLEMDIVDDYFFGMVIVNDWSARDIQKWEYQPLGPFNGKNFMTSISPWVVCMEALQDCRVAQRRRAAQDPGLLEYLESKQDDAYDIVVEVYLSSEKMRKEHISPICLSRSNFAQSMYWSFSQMLAHHTSTGCNIQVGDLLASGTISGNSSDSLGSLLEITQNGKISIDLPDGDQRVFLLDGDEVTMKAYAQRKDGIRIGFGSCRARVVSNPSRHRVFSSQGLKTFMHKLIDYAGLFPPAALSYDDAYLLYLDYQRLQRNEVVSRFILPFSKAHQLNFSDLDHSISITFPKEEKIQDCLEEVESLKQYLKDKDLSLEIPIPKEVLQDSDKIDLFLSQLNELLFKNPAKGFCFVELPVFKKDEKFVRLFLKEMSKHFVNRLGVKMRLGSMDPKMVPSTKEVAEFIYQCSQVHIPVKATAGLHHPIYRANAKSHGFINVFAAGFFASHYPDFGREKILEILEDENAKSFLFSNEGLHWKGYFLSNEEMKLLRENCFISFGSCSVDEPMEALTQLGWMN